MSRDRVARSLALSSAAGRWCSLHCRPALLLQCLLLALLAPTTALAQSRLDRELAFVRGLLRDLRLPSLAAHELDRLASEYRDPADQDAIALLAASTDLAAASASVDAATALAACRRALERCHQLAERTDNAAVQKQARASLAAAAIAYAERRADADAGLDAAARDETDQVLRRGIDACRAVLGELGPEPRPQPLSPSEGRLGLQLGVLLRRRGELAGADGGYLIDRAEATLETLVLDLGESTALGLRGLLEIAHCQQLRRASGTAARLYEHVQQAAAAALPAPGRGAADELRPFLAELLQEASWRLGELRRQQGDADGAAAALRPFFAWLRAEAGADGDRFAFASPRHGHAALLLDAWLRADRGEAGELTAALAAAQRLLQLHPADALGRRARALAQEVLVERDAALPAVARLQAATDALAANDLVAAITGSRSALAALTDADPQRLGLQGSQVLGEAFWRSGRPLEAALALHRGLARFAAADASLAATAAELLDQALALLQTQSGDDPALAELLTNGTALVAQYGGSRTADKTAWRLALQLLAARQYAAAGAQLRAISTAFPMYPLAQARLATAQAASGDRRAAAATLEALRPLLREPSATAAAEPLRQQALAQARTEAEFRAAELLATDALGQPPARPADPTRLAAAIAACRAFLANHGNDGGPLLPLALDRLARLHVELGELDLAEAAFAQLQLRPDQAEAGSRLATLLFQARQQQAANLQLELARATTPAATTAAAAELQVVQSRLLQLGMAHAAGSPQPQLGILVAAMQAAFALGELQRCVDLAAIALREPGAAGSERARQLDQYVVPELARALLALHRFDDAHRLLVAAIVRAPLQAELLVLDAESLGGWFQFDGKGQGLRIRGLDQPAAAYELHYGRGRELLLPRLPRWSLAWYRFHWQAYWYARQAGDRDERYRAAADAIYRTCRSVDDFAALRGAGSEGEALAQQFRIWQPGPGGNR